MAMSDYVIDKSGCWVWAGSCRAGGSPIVYREGRMVSARRAILQETKGFRIDRRTKVMRGASCHPKCVNPEHCYLKRNHEVNEAFLENYGAHRRRRVRETTVQKIERLEKDRKKWSI